ncbi:MAG: YlmC/YmxH family sporulation protein [Clostridia bacterium]|nr:YlmC/YmxH family sporulation protein [Clostridia bacterium]
MVSFNDLKKKSVVNILDGKKLGKVKDLTFDFPAGRISAFIVGEQKLFPTAENDLIVKLCCVDKIGDDAVLVSLTEPTPASAEDE